MCGVVCTVQPNYSVEVVLCCVVVGFVTKTLIGLESKFVLLSTVNFLIFFSHFLDILNESARNVKKNVNNDSSREMANFGHCGPFGGNFTQKYKILLKLSLHKI